MPVMLRTEPGYYARVVEIDGSKFYIADLGDAWDEYVDRCAALREHSGIDVADSLLDPAKLFELAQDLANQPERQKQIRRELADLIDWVLGLCLVKWDLAAECDAVARRALPAHVKSQLAQEVVAASQLSLGEATFLERVGTGDTGRR